MNGSTEVLRGEDGLLDAVTRPDVDLVISALVGFAGLRPTLRAIEAGKDIALANKETLVVAGELVMRTVAAARRAADAGGQRAQRNSCSVCRGRISGRVARLILTASGGPFLHLGQGAISDITPAEALQHPTWRMGNKISIDSATLMNKGLEVIEAHWLFGLPASTIEVVIHPQSIIHSMVEFVDGSVKAQLGIPDMKLPIQYALTYPERPASAFTRLDFAALGRMTFLAPGYGEIPLSGSGVSRAGDGRDGSGGVECRQRSCGRAFSRADAFPSARYPTLIEEALTAHQPGPSGGLDDIIHADRETRAFVQQQITAVSF